MPMGIGPGLSVTRFESGIPGWMTGMDLGWDFTQNVQYSGATNPTDTHSATIYAQSSSGVWSPFGANVLTQTDLGLQTVPTRIDFAINNTSFGSGWAFVNTTTAASATSPEASNANAFTVTQGSGASDGITFGRPVAIAGATNHIVSPWFLYTGSVRWLRVDLTDNVAGGFQGWVDLQNSVMGSSRAFGTGTLVSATLQAGPKGWYRLILIGTVASGTGSTSFGSTITAVTADNGTTRAAGTYGFYALNIQAGSFAVPPIITGASTTTVGGNQQVVDLTGKLASGVGGILQFVLPQGPAVSARVFSFDDGSVDNRVFCVADTSAVTFQMTTASAFQGLVTALGTPAISGTLYTAAFAASGNYFNMRIVGQSLPTPDTASAFPVINRLQIAGSSNSPNQNGYQITKRLALQFGVQNAATFADLVAKATILAAVS